MQQQMQPLTEDEQQMQELPQQPFPDWRFFSLADFRHAYPLYPASSHAVWSSAVQLSCEPHCWAELTVEDVPELQCYVLRGVSTRLRRQQEERAWRRHQREQRQQEEEAARHAESAAAAAAGTAASEPVPPVTAVPVPALLEETVVPPFQFVLPTDARRQWKHDIFSRVFDVLDVPSVLVCLFSPPSFLTFLAVHRGCFHVLPRSVLAKDGIARTELQTGSVAYGDGADGGGEDAAFSAFQSLSSDLAPAHLSRRQAKKRKLAERAVIMQQQQQQQQQQDWDGPPPPSAQVTMRAQEDSEVQQMPSPPAAAQREAGSEAVNAPAARRPRRQRQNE